MPVKTVGIRELKTHLSRYLKEVRSGSTTVVTDRGTPIAHIAPLGEDAKETPEERIIDL
jgi:prevent-host-death family protein